MGQDLCSSIQIIPEGLFNFHITTYIAFPYLIHSSQSNSLELLYSTVLSLSGYSFDKATCKILFPFSVTIKSSYDKDACTSLLTTKHWRLSPYLKRPIPKPSTSLYKKLNIYLLQYHIHSFISIFALKWQCTSKHFKLEKNKTQIV